jgi:protein-arginine kinase activator protein McsA
MKPEWNGQPLRLQIDHINGNPVDNRQENLRFLCPNCHSQTINFGTKNVKRPTGRKRSTGGVGSRIVINEKGKKERALKHRKELICSGCGTQFLKLNHRILPTNYCTSECKKKYQSSQTKANWPPDAELVVMVKSSSRLQVGKLLGVSDKAVSKRLKRIGV